MQKKFFFEKNFWPQKLEKRDFLGQKIVKNGSFGEHASTGNPTWVVDSLKFS